MTFEMGAHICSRNRVTRSISDHYVNIKSLGSNLFDYFYNVYYIFPLLTQMYHPNDAGSVRFQ